MTSGSLENKHSCRGPPDVGLAPSTAGGPSPSIPPRTPPPTPGWAAPSRTPGALQKEPRGVGGRGRERAGRGGKGFGLREGSSNCNGGWGGTLQTPVGPDHIWGLPILASRDVIISSQFAARIRRGFFTLGDGCWLPKVGLSVLRLSLFCLRLVFVAYGTLAWSLLLTVEIRFGLCYLWWNIGLVFFAYGSPRPQPGLGLLCLRLPPSQLWVWSFLLTVQRPQVRSTVSKKT